MPTRTFLTTPPGRSASQPVERYVPGLAPPTEVAAPSRWRRPVLAGVALLALALLVAAIVRTTGATQAEDPSLGPPPQAATARR